MNKFTCPCCKYEFEMDYTEGKKENDFIIKGDKKPIELHLSNSIKVHVPSKELWSDDEIVSLFACPHCKTVVVNL